MIKHLAHTIRNQYGSCPQTVFEQQGVEVVDMPLAGRIKEIYFGTSVVVKSGISLVERTYYLAHALGHHVIHKTGNYLYCDSMSYLTTIRREREAEDFAAHFLITDADIEQQMSLYSESTLGFWAHQLGVSIHPLNRRIELYKQEHSLLLN